MDVGQLEVLAPLIFGIIFVLTVGGVILLKPIANKLGHLLEAMAEERKAPRFGEDLERMRDLMDTISGRLALLEERQDFTDGLLADPERRKLRPGPSPTVPAGEEQ